MEDLHRARYVGRGQSSHTSSGQVTLSASPSVHNAEALRSLSLGFYGHFITQAGINHCLIVIVSSLALLPLWESEGGIENFNPLIT